MTPESLWHHKIVAMHLTHKIMHRFFYNAWFVTSSFGASLANFTFVTNQNQIINFIIESKHDVPGILRSQALLDTSANGNFFRVTGLLRGVHRSVLNSPRKGQWGGALMFSFISAWTNGWVNSRDAEDLRRRRAHYDDIFMPGATRISQRMLHFLP